MATLYCVILAGGLGSRLWPLSREAFPKQNFKVNDDKTLFQQTFLRMSNLVDDKNIITTTNVKHASAIREQLNKIQEKFGRKLNYKMLTEPDFRNTASALALATKYIEEKDVEILREWRYSPETWVK
jgi:mannose-1-phosphate guanylyltransferase